jgi:uncharacterized protein (TIGR03067 family)
VKTLTPLVAALLLFADDKPPPPKLDPAVVAELQRLQGSWQAEAWEEAGKPLAGGELKKRTFFFGANIFYIRSGEKLLQGGAAQLAPTKKPRTINFSVKEGEGADGVMLGIYSLDGDTLKLCFDPQGESRPKDFKAGEKSGFTRITLKRPKPPADEAINIVGEYNSEMVDAMTGKVVAMDVTIERRGDAYILRYKLDDKPLFAGIALRKGNMLAMSWVSPGQSGVSLYKIEAGPKLVGDHTVMGGVGLVGKEVLTARKKDDI